MTREQIKKIIGKIIREEFQNYVSSTDLLTMEDVDASVQGSVDSIMTLWDKGFVYDLRGKDG